MNKETIMISIPYEDYRNLIDADKSYFSLIQDLILILKDEKVSYSKWSKELEFPHLQENVNNIYKKYFENDYQRTIENLKEEKENDE